MKAHLCMPPAWEQAARKLIVLKNLVHDLLHGRLLGFSVLVSGCGVVPASMQDKLFSDVLVSIMELAGCAFDSW